jgi:MiaB/RimO family radical SAM methylthiotransferase
MKKIVIRSSGCEQRNLDAVYLEKLAIANKDYIIQEPWNADIIIYVSCCVSEYATSISIKEIEILCAQAPLAKVIVYGCLPGICKSDLYRKGIYTYLVMQKGEMIHDMGWTIQVDYPVLTESDYYESTNINSVNPRQEFDYAKKSKKLIISDGCLNRCTYCVIRYSTGSLKSKRVEQIKAEWNANITSGDTVMLMGGDTGAYGLDIGTNLSNLLRELLEEGTDVRIYLHDLNIRWMNTYLEPFCRVIRDFSCIRGLTLPIQSGSDAILKQMDRKYCVADIVKCFGQIRLSRPDVILGTHIIIGFPNESDYDMAQTISCLKQINPDFISCFPYSEHPMALSAQYFPKISSEEVVKRIVALKDIFGTLVKIYS